MLEMPRDRKRSRQRTRTRKLALWVMFFNTAWFIWKASSQYLQKALKCPHHHSKWLLVCQLHLSSGSNETPVLRLHWWVWGAVLCRREQTGKNNWTQCYWVALETCWHPAQGCEWDLGELFSFPCREPFPEMPLPPQFEVCSASAGLVLRGDFVMWLWWLGGLAKLAHLHHSETKMGPQVWNQNHQNHIKPWRKDHPVFRVSLAIFCFIFF